MSVRTPLMPNRRATAPLPYIQVNIIQILQHQYIYLHGFQKRIAKLTIFCLTFAENLALDKKFLNERRRHL